jgi:hypothetical protein
MAREEGGQGLCHPAGILHLEEVCRTGKREQLGVGQPGEQQFAPLAEDGALRSPRTRSAGWTTRPASSGVNDHPWTAGSSCPKKVSASAMACSKASGERIPAQSGSPGHKRLASRRRRPRPCHPRGNGASLLGERFQRSASGARSPAPGAPCPAAPAFARDPGRPTPAGERSSRSKSAPRRGTARSPSDASAGGSGLPGRRCPRDHPPNRCPRTPRGDTGVCDTARQAPAPAHRRLPGGRTRARHPRGLRDPTWPASVGFSGALSGGRRSGL